MNGRVSGEPEGPIETFLWMLDGISARMQGFKPNRFPSRVRNGLRISTVETPDMGWETAIIDKQGPHPVERYGSLEQAKEGHETWTKRAHFIKELTEIGYGDMIEDERIILERETDIFDQDEITPGTQGGKLYE